MSNIFHELKRRKVFQVGAAYVVLGWLLIQVADTIAPMMNLPDTAPRFVLFLLIILFPIALFLAWAFEIRPTENTDGESHPAQGLLPVIGSMAVLGVVGFLLLWGSEEAPDEALPISEEGGAVAVPEPAPGSIAVLPFADLSPAGDQEYFADGIAEELLNVLATLDELSVASRTSAFAFKGENRNIADIADVLGVAHVVEGSVRKAGDRIRITAQLIDAKSDRQLWSDAFDRELTMDNLLAIQDEIANAIVGALRNETSITIDRNVSIDQVTEELDAYELYLRAQQLAAIDSLENLRRRLVLLERAIELDPEFAQAIGQQAILMSFQPGWNLDVDPETSYRKAIDIANRALAIDPTVIDAYMALENSHFALGEWDRVDALVLRAREHLADYDYMHWTLARFGYLRRASERARRLEAIHPGDGFLNVIQGIQFDAVSEHEKAIAQYEIAIDKGYQGGLDRLVAKSRWSMGDTATWTAMTSFEFEIFDPELLPLLPYMKELMSAKPADRAGASRRLLTVARELGLSEDDLISRGPRFLLRAPVEVVVLMGHADKVADGFWGSWSKHWMWDSSYREFRQTEAFRSRIRESGMLAYWQKNDWPDLCRAVGDDDFECD
jgi:adenylate cyclase